MRLKTVLNAWVTAAVMAACITPAIADAVAEGSQEIGSGAVSVAASPLISVEGHPFEAISTAATGSAFIVVGVGVGAVGFSNVILQKAADGSKATVAVSAQALKSAGLAVGSTVNAVSEATGYALIASGKLLAFIPNEAGKALLHSEKVAPAATQQ